MGCLCTVCLGCLCSHARLPAAGRSNRTPFIIKVNAIVPIAAFLCWRPCRRLVDRATNGSTTLLITYSFVSTHVEARHLRRCDVAVANPETIRSAPTRIPDVRFTSAPSIVISTAFFLRLLVSLCIVICIWRCPRNDLSIHVSDHLCSDKWVPTCTVEAPRPAVPPAAPLAS